MSISYKEIKFGTKVNNFIVLGTGEPKYYTDKNGGTTTIRTMRCKCKCGVVKTIDWGNLISGRTKSCGCVPKRCKIQGLSKHPLYWVWVSMKERCYNKNCHSYDNYGGRGVTICKEWRNNFKSFYNWCIDNGWKKGLQIDKDIKGSMLYSPDTCCIVTRQENMGYRRNSIRVYINGVLMSIKEISKLSQNSYGYIQWRIKSGVVGEELFNKPKHKNK